jgi:hypothetical protein
MKDLTLALSDPSSFQAISKVSTDHVKTAVRKIDHTHDAKDQREPRGKKK